MAKDKRPALAAPKRARGPRPKLSITLDPVVLAAVELRMDAPGGRDRSGVLSRDLARYYALLREARARLRAQLTPAELSAILDVQNGHLYGSGLLWSDEIWVNVEDGCRLDGLAEKWAIDGAALVAKLRALDLLAVHALADATQRFWHAVGSGDQTRAPARALD